MSDWIAALPMYDWPELRVETDAQWAMIRDRLRAVGIAAPQFLTRENTSSGVLDLAMLWRDPALLLAQTCWGPMELGLAEQVQVVGQVDYSGFEGGDGALYSSTLVMRRPQPASSGRPETDIEAPSNGRAVLPLDLLRGRRFAFNSVDSMSGYLALRQDLAAQGENLALFSEQHETGSHRASIRAVAEGRADVASIDCRSWQLSRRFEPDSAAGLQVVGWTARRKGLPFITAKSTPRDVVAVLRDIMADMRRGD